MLHVVDCARALLFAAAIAASPCAAAQEQQRVNPDAKALAEFQEEIDEYVKLHKKLEQTLPALPKEAPSEAIDQHQQALARLIQAGAQRQEARRYLRERRAAGVPTAAPRASSTDQRGVSFGRPSWTRTPGRR